LTFMGDALRDAFDTRLGIAALRGRAEPKPPTATTTEVTP
jgi:microcin C transport system permease protein